MDAEKQYRNYSARLFQNLSGDPNLEASEKDRFLAHLGDFPGGDFEDWLNDFFYAPYNQRMGPNHSLSDEAILGTTKLLSRIGQLIGAPELMDMEPIDAEDFIRGLSAKNRTEIRALIMSIFEEDDVLAPFQNWSFIPDEDNADGFESLDHARLPCALGLPTDSIEEHASFGHKIAHDDSVHVPTAFDAGLMEEWQPGGRTKPHAECEDDFPDGHEEIVHRKVKLRNISTRIFITKE